MGGVNIEINDILEKYLRREFECENGDIILRRDKPIGRFIVCHTRWSKEKPRERENTIKVLIPDSPHADHEFYFGYMTREDQRSVRDFIQASFDLRIETFFVKGYRLKFQQKDIINALMEHYKLPINSSVFEMIKKRDLRKRTNVKKIIANIIDNY